MYCIYTIEALIKKTREEILNNIRSKIDVEVSQQQILAWEEEIEFLKNNLKEYNKNHYIIFEYTITEGKRPDVILLTSNNVLVLEFKTGPNAIKNIDAHLEQTYNYKKRIEKYHIISREQKYNIESFLVFSHKESKFDDNILNNDNFKLKIGQFMSDNPIEKTELEKWILSPYQAIPSILESVSFVFKSGKLPEIIKSKSDINETLNIIGGYIEKPKNKIQIIFVSGEPGSGKTLLGIGIVNRYKEKARFLTGNGPLSKVLQYQIDKATGHELCGEAFIGHLTSWIKQGEEKVSSKYNRPNWKENIFVFDEAQRAWNHEKNISLRRSKNSQPEQIIKLICQEVKIPNKYITLICLIGEGQEIHSGEEDGIYNWINALNKINKSKIGDIFHIVAPTCISRYFIDKNKIEINDKLYLDNYFRGYEEDIYPKWVNALLDWNEKELERLTKQLNYNKYPIYITKTLNSAKKHIMDRYNTYGLCLSSSGAQKVKKYCKQRINQKEKNSLFTLLGSEAKEINTLNKISKIKEFNSYTTYIKFNELIPDLHLFDFGNGIENNNEKWKHNVSNNWILSEVEKDRVAQWFENESKKLKTYTTEFNSQGLELDFEIFGFGGDLELKDGKWKVNTIDINFKEKDRLKMFINRHRVLLTRCREGIILWIPEIFENKELYDKLKNIGVKELR